ncbi:MAG TPA: AAA family ATPase, partial [Acidimicrobiales bacterium]|nr:AAA family ATPase [Acidimicrobiales bacterium]
MRSTDLVSILCTDWVNSTATRSRLGEERFDALQQIHEKMLEEVLGERGGEVVKWTGDGVLAVFHSATDAIGAAVAIQQRFDRYSNGADAIAPVQLRIGIAVGDVVHRDDDIHGSPVVEAVRLQAAAGTSKIVCSDAVRVLARGRGGFEFDLLGMLELKGLPEPVAASEVRWERPAVPPSAAFPLPPELAGVGELPFVGRRSELSWAADRVTAADRPQGVWLMGEPGIGKTRLAAEVATRCHDGNAIVLFGRCDEAMAAPFQPVITALRWYVANLGDGLEASALGPDPAPLCRLVPEIATRIPGLGEASGPASEAEQFRMFESVRGWLNAAAAATPLLFVIDDVHWADRPTLALIGHVLRGAEQVHLTVLGTARDTAPDRSGPLAELMDSLAATRRSHVRRLTGLTEADVSTLVGPERAELLLTETAGNPLFLSAVLEGGDTSSSPDLLPGGVTAAVGRWVRRLSPPVQEMLQAASVIGPEVDLSVVASMSSCDESTALGLMEAACEAGLLVEVGVERFRFAHAMVRDAISSTVGPTRTTRLHAAAAAAIEARFAGALEEHVAALAFHHAGARHPGEALHYEVLAAERALQLLAFDAAVEHYQKALEQSERTDPHGQTPTRFRLLLSKGHAERLAADHTGALATLHDAAILARTEGSWEDYAHAALSFEEASWRPGLRAAEASAFLEDVVRRAPDPDIALARRAAISLARSYHYTGRFEDATTLADKALSEARRVGDPVALVHALTVSSQVRVPIFPAEADDVVALASEVWDLRENLSDLDEVCTVSEYALVSELIRGDGPGVDRWFGRLGSLSTVVETRFAQYVHINMQSMRALLAADLVEAEALAERSQELGRQLGEDVSGVYGLQMFLVRREQDRLRELAPMVQMLLSKNPVAEMWQPGLIALLAELGMRDEGRQLLNDLVR